MPDSDQTKRCRSMVAHITALPSDLTWKISKHIIADDVVDYVCFRATCSVLRSSLPDPCDLAFSYLPRNWIRVYSNSNEMSIRMDNVKGSFIMHPHMIDSDTRAPFIHLPTGRYAELVLPQLETYSIFSVTDGLLILVHKKTGVMRIFNPLTRCMSADLPPTLEITEIPFYAVTVVAPSRSTVEPPTLMVALEIDNIVYFAKPGEEASVKIQLQYCITSALFFKDQFYCTDVHGSIWKINPDQKSVNCVFYQDIGTRCWDLVESRTGMLLVDLYPIFEGMCNNDFGKFNVFSVDLNANTIIPILKGMCNNACGKFNVFMVDLNANTIIPANDIGNCTIFVGDRQRALLVTPTKISIKRNSIYFCCVPSFI